MKQVLAFLSVIIIAGCNKEVTDKVDQDKIFSQYLLRYDESTDVTSATATFRFNNASGTRLQLSEPSTIQVDNNGMDWNSEEGNYEADFSGFKTSAQFDWVDLDGNSFSNEVSIVDVAFPDSISDLSYSDSISYFTWQGTAPLDSFELIRLTIDGPGDTDRRSFLANELGATEIIIDSVSLSQIDTGQVTLILEKQFSPELQESNSAGGTGIGSYIPVSRNTDLRSN